MKVKPGIIFLIFFLIFFNLSADSENHNAHHFDWSGFWGKVLNSTILFGGLILLLRKPLINFFSQKSLDIKNDIIQREKSIAESKEKFTDIKLRLSKIEEEVEKMKQLAMKSGEDEKKRIEETGKTESQRILAITETEINNKIEASIRRLKEKIAELTIENFKRDIEAKLDPEIHKKIIDKNIKASGEIIERE